MAEEQQKTKTDSRKRVSQLSWILSTLVLCIVAAMYLASAIFKRSLIRLEDAVDMSDLMPYINKLLLICVLFIIFRILNHLLLKTFLRHAFRKLEVEDQYQRVFRLSNFVWWVLFTVGSVYLVVGNATAIFASIGLIGFGITFALQKPILNFVGWLNLVMKCSYSEGDRIRVGNIRGDVREIQVMNTVLDGLLHASDVPSGKTITFPNELVLTTDVENYTKTSNYVLEEIHIGITYESDYRKAMDILRDIITRQIQKNRPNYIKRIRLHEKRLNMFITKLLNRRQAKACFDNELDEEAKRLEREKERIQSDLRELEDEFRPKLRLNLLDSGIDLIAQFITPYNHIGKNRTEIYIKFMDAIKQEKDIEIAYPHVEIVSRKQA